MRAILNIGVLGWVAINDTVLSTITAFIQILNHFRDRADVVLKVRKNMKTLIPGYHGMTLVIVTATNVGRRPATISGFAAKLLFGQENTDWVLGDIRPPLPCEITEGKDVSAFVNQEGVDFEHIAYWYAWDSTGRHFKLNVAPWHKRWISAWRLRK